jgi:hypothetical protein
MNETIFPISLCKLLKYRLTLYIREEYISYITQAHLSLLLNACNYCKQIGTFSCLIVLNSILCNIKSCLPKEELLLPLLQLVMRRIKHIEYLG